MDETFHFVRNLEAICIFSELHPPLSESLESSQAQIRRMTSAERNPGSSVTDLSLDFPAPCAGRDFLWTMRGFSNNECGSAAVYLGTTGDETEPLSRSRQRSRPRRRLSLKEQGHAVGIRLILS